MKRDPPLKAPMRKEKSIYKHSSAQGGWDMMSFMKKHKIEFVFAAAVGSLIFGVISTSHAFWPVHDNLNWLKLIEQTRNQAIELQNWVDQLKNLDPKDIQIYIDANKEETELYRKLQNKTEGLFKELDKLEENYDDLFGETRRPPKEENPDWNIEDVYKNSMDYNAELENVSKSATNTLETMNKDNFETRKKSLDNAVKHCKTAKGGLQAAQGQAEILALIARELQSNNKILSELLKIEASKASTEVAEKKDADEYSGRTRPFENTPRKYQAAFDINNPPVLK